MMVVEMTPETGDTTTGMGVGVGNTTISEIPAAIVGEMVGHGGHVGTTTCTGETIIGIVGHGGHVGITTCTGETTTGITVGQTQNGKVGMGRVRISRRRSGLIRVGQKQPDDEVTIICSPPIFSRLLTSYLQ